MYDGPNINELVDAVYNNRQHTYSAVEAEAEDQRYDKRPHQQNAGRASVQHPQRQVMRQLHAAMSCGVRE